MKLLCRIRGHTWIDPAPAELERYRETATVALVGWPGQQREEIVTVTWFLEEVCARCGAEKWFPY